MKKPIACICEWCGVTFQRVVGRRNLGRFCTKKHWGAYRTSLKKPPVIAICVCRGCGAPREKLFPYCESCRVQRAPQLRPCLQCGKPTFNKTCSPECRSARMHALLSGKKYRPAKVYDRPCTQCGQGFLTRSGPTKVCHRCMKRGRGKYRDRCRRAGVPYLTGVTPEKVFLRDGYHCQLCGCATPKRLRGTYKPNAPELDHIIPINAKGGSPGHAWNNVQCACRKCNIRKSAKPLGQLRLAV
jgi:hypothetical protein